MRWRRGSLLSVLFAPLALLGAVAPVRGTQNDGECPLKSLVWTTAPKDLSACYPGGKLQGADADALFDAEAATWLADSAAAALRSEARAKRKPPAPLARAAGEGAYNATAAYNTLIGSTLIGRTYHFTEDPIPLEGARIMAAAGARMHKFRLSPLIPPDVEAKMAKAGLLPSLLAGVGRRLAQAGGRPKKRYVGSLLEAATHPDLGYDKIFDSPEINRFVFWAYAVNNSNAYNEYYDLVSHLITKYQGTGKAFYIGHWEGDWAIRSNYQDPVMPDRVAHFRRTLSAMQRAIDTAKADYAHLIGGESGVKVWGYAECNRVLTSMVDPSYKSFINQVVPYINPPIDFVSYSNWEIEEAQERSADELGPVLHAALDFIACHLPPKPCVPEPRVFEGEFGYFLLTKTCAPLMAPPLLAGSGPHTPTTPDIVAARTMWHYAQTVAWGAPMTLFWQLYSNEAGTDAAGAACDRAYWLVDRAGDDAPVFTSLKAFYAAADAHLAAARAAGGPLPDLNAFRRWAVANLVELSGYSGVPPPAFRELDLAAAAIGGGH